jgi:hypothetical protein
MYFHTFIQHMKRIHILSIDQKVRATYTYINSGCPEAHILTTFVMQKNQVTCLQQATRFKQFSLQKANKSGRLLKNALASYSVHSAIMSTTKKKKLHSDQQRRGLQPPAISAAVS